VSREILVHIGEGEKYVAVVDDGKLDNFHIESEHHQSIVGNIYKGRVESILPSINGAFVNIGQPRNGFLYLTDTVNPLVEEEISGPRKFINKLLNKREKRVVKKDEVIPLKIGQDILVQVVKDPFANKGGRLTTHISLAGRFLVYMPYDHHHGVSRKIEDHDERHRLKELLKEFTVGKSGGFIVRTVSSEKGKKEFGRDAEFLEKKWQEIIQLAEKSKAPALVYKEYDLIWKVVRDYLTEDINKVTIDSYPHHLEMRKIVENLIGKEMVDKIICYRGHVPLFESKSMAAELEKIYDSRIYLKSGAHIVIEPTEGLTVVDVNSGKFKTKANPEDAAYMVNMEAAPEIARQLRLRDLGGIIVIDFIDMSKEGHKRKVLETLEDALTRDRAKTEVNRISQLGLVEMTRERTGKTLESISFTSCPYCDGRGRVRLGVSKLPFHDQKTVT
jgi:ribonuclease G